MKSQVGERCFKKQVLQVLFNQAREKELETSSRVGHPLADFPQFFSLKDTIFASALVAKQYVENVI